MTWNGPAHPDDPAPPDEVLVEDERALTARERVHLRKLAAWRRYVERPRSLSGLVALGRVRVIGAPFVRLAAVYAIGTGRVSLFDRRELVGQLGIDEDGELHPRRSILRWLADATALPDRAALDLRLELELRLLERLRVEVWPAARVEIEELRARYRAAAPPERPAMAPPRKRAARAKRADDAGGRS